jgi:hypothetical protein
MFIWCVNLKNDSGNPCGINPVAFVKRTQAKTMGCPVAIPLAKPVAELDTTSIAQSIRPTASVLTWCLGAGGKTLQAASHSWGKTLGEAADKWVDPLHLTHNCIFPNRVNHDSTRLSIGRKNPFSHLCDFVRPP